MSPALKIDSVNTASLVELTSSEVALLVNTSTDLQPTKNETGKTTSRILTTQAPRLQPPDDADSDQTKSGDLLKFILVMMQALYKMEILLTKFMANAASDQTSMGKEYADAVNAAAVKALQKLQDMVDSKKEADKWGVLSDVFKWIGTALAAMVLGVITGGIGPAIVFGAVGALSNSGVMSDALDNIGGGQVGDFCVKMAVVTAASGLASPVAGLIDEGISAAFTAAGSAGDSVVKVTADSAADGVANGISKQNNLLTGSVFGQVFGTLNPLNNLLTAMVNPGQDDAKTKEIISIISQVTTMIITLVACYKITTANPAVMDGTAGQMLGKINLPLLMDIMRTLTALSTLGGAGATMAEGAYMLKRAEILKEKASSDKAYEILMALAGKNQSDTENTSTWIKDTMADFQIINSTFPQLVLPYVYAAQVKG